MANNYIQSGRQNSASSVNHDQNEQESKGNAEQKEDVGAGKRDQHKNSDPCQDPKQHQCEKKCFAGGYTLHDNYDLPDDNGCAMEHQARIFISMPYKNRKGGQKAGFEPAKTRAVPLG